MGESDSLDVPGNFPTVARERRLTACVAAGISSCHEPIATRDIRERELWDVRRNQVVPLIVDEGEKQGGLWRRARSLSTPIKRSWSV
jgi:hypothetical protein